MNEHFGPKYKEIDYSSTRVLILPQITMPKISGVCFGGGVNIILEKNETPRKKSRLINLENVTDLDKTGISDTCMSCCAQT